MRNTKQYPITLAEIEECLLQLSREIAEQNEQEENIGDMRPLLLMAAAMIVRRTGLVTFNLED